MCVGSESRKSSSSAAVSSSSPSPASSSSPSTMSRLLLDSEDSPSLLELAANNDVELFKLCVERSPSAADAIGPWYGRKNGSTSNQMVLDYRTPLMVAATYGSVEVLDLILSLGDVDVNRRCGSDKTTALHCAASGGSVTAADAVKALLLAGADPDAVDAAGRRPSDVIVVPPRLPLLKPSLEDLLGSTPPADDFSNLRVSLSLPSSPEDSDSFSSSPTAVKPQEIPPPATAEREKREYPIDPSLPDIKNSIYATDEFRMFSFKVRPCSRAYSHDWTECPFVHPGENARRRDPRKYHYSCVPCPDFRKGTCRRGDLCEYAHGVFECWLHPAQYRTRLCKDGIGCTRRVCFFAHTAEELRPLYVSTGSAVPSPRSSASAAMDMAAAMSLLPGSPSAVSVMSPSPFTPPMSPSAGGGGLHSAMSWQQSNVPTLHLPGGNLQSSRLRSSLSARDIPVEDYSLLPDFDAQQILNEFPSFSSSAQQSRLSSLRRPKALAPSNLEDLFSMEMPSSPRYNSDQVPVFSPTHKAAFLNQFQQQQQQQQSLLSPVNTAVFSPKAPAEPSHTAFLQNSLGVISPRFGAQRDQQHLRSSGLPAAGTPASSAGELWPRWGGSPAGKLDWGGLNGDGGGGGGGAGEEPDVSWVQSLVKEPSPEMVKSKAMIAAAASDSGNGGAQTGGAEHTVLGAWMEQLQLD